MSRKILILAAHPDDPIITMGGTVRKLVKDGNEVNVFAFGNGDEAYSTPGGSAEAVRKYAAASVKAYEILGCHLETLSLPDFEVFQTRELYHECIRAIRKYKPDSIFAHYWGEYFQHTGMATISRDAWNQAQWTCSGDLGEAWTCPKYYHFHGRDGVSEVTHVVDVTDTLEDGLEAIKHFQFDFGAEHEIENFMKVKAEFAGAKIGVKYGEMFQQCFYYPEKITDSENMF